MLKSRNATCEDMREILAETLGLQSDRVAAMSEHSLLLGAIPELDSFAIVQLAIAIEERFGIALDDSDFTPELFATLGSLAALIDERRTL